MDQRLKGRRIAALAADGFEKVELLVPMKALQAAGAEVDVIPFVQGCLDLSARRREPVASEEPKSAGNFPAGLGQPSARYRCTNITAIAPSPTADAQRLTEPWRTSPAAKRPGMLVSR